MNQKLFNELMKDRPSQYAPEWQMFLEICEMYLKKNKIENPITVELGTYTNKQKQFYEQLLGAEHIGIDFTDKRGMPDILANLHDPKTVELLKKKLKGRSINILFIDASHFYEKAKRDFEMYSPLCSDIIAFHDIENCRFILRKKSEVWRLWDDMKEQSHKGEKFKDYIFLSIHQYKLCKHYRGQMGIGVMIRK